MIVSTSLGEFDAGALISRDILIDNWFLPLTGKIPLSVQIYKNNKKLGLVFYDLGNIKKNLITLSIFPTLLWLELFSSAVVILKAQ